jgi:hypothetical protein
VELCDRRTRSLNAKCKVCYENDEGGDEAATESQVAQSRFLVGCSNNITTARSLKLDAT